LCANSRNRTSFDPPSFLPIRRYTIEEMTAVELRGQAVANRYSAGKQ
jgi:hypothetical protein